ncbi:putative serine protease K12H4.7 [Gigantopelta aegis]|uniref:putative serine protease K12H4.7 n=1 Tax=Gigantopelta aegis TaxID=1735272 RepID=UPI001B889030|nr:putative serine protease K12H4.7 [Gigantopelta aegis]
MNTILFIVFCALGFELGNADIPHFFRGRPKGGMVGVPRLTRGYNPVFPPDEWMTQTLDHFNDADTRTWQQRYFVNATFYKPGGPVFLMIGGEGTASPIWMVEGMWIAYAQIYGAMCFQVEHRFYGKSHPTSDMSVDNLRYLSSEQALADLASFIVFAKQKYNLQNNKWISFGGSYPGSLSAWVRMKYPHLIDGAVATSAPLLAVLDFKDYLGVVRDSLDTTGPGCNKAISEATCSIQKQMQSSSGRKDLKKLFTLCDDIDNTKTNDVINFYSTLAGNFEGVVQYNKDNRAFEGAKGTNITVDTLCAMMTDSGLGDPVSRYAAVNAMMLATYSEKCLDFSYTNMIDDLRKVDWNSSAAEGGRQWTYQTCTEFAFFQSTDLKDQPFGQTFPVNFSIQQCIDIFGPKFNVDLINRGIKRTNTNYGARGIKISKVVFPNGSIDPWHALGITKDISSDARAIYINGTAHCANMYPPAVTDTDQLRAARMNIMHSIGKWIKS